MSEETPRKFTFRTDFYGNVWVCNQCGALLGSYLIRHLRKEHAWKGRRYQGMLAHFYEKIKVGESKDGTQYVLNHHGAFAEPLADFIPRMQRHFERYRKLSE